MGKATARGKAWLIRLPWGQEIAGSNPAAQTTSSALVV